ncbi:hypothetical protein PINS_up009859 [Pythium insidiosum]|nr:hypothetical protein PINS_up009859 [Pythium insidiosum]
MAESAAPPKEKPLRRALRWLQGAIGKRLLSLCWVTYALGLVWVLLHPAATVSTGELKCRGTYISENALLVDSIAASMSSNEAASVHERKSVARSRSQGTESIVLVAHVTPSLSSSDAFTSVALGLELLQFLSRARWLAKDVVLLVADDGETGGADGVSPGTDAWLAAYHSDPLHAAPLGGGRAGVIRAAINLEAASTDGSVPTAVGVFTAGCNGQLPNLDLVNTAVSHCRSFGVPVVLDRCETMTAAACPPAATFAGAALDRVLFRPLQALLPSADAYLANLKGMLRFMTTLATGPSGPHASFIRYNIDAITFSLVRSPQRHDALSTEDVLRSLELLLRSLSNIEEKLHQSFFLYVLPNADTFVSVGEYYYTVALAVSPAIVHLLVLLASRDASGLRVALALVAVAALEAVGGLLAAVALRTVARTTTDPMRTQSVYLVVGLTTLLQIAIVTVVVPWLRTLPVLRGNTAERRWCDAKDAFDRATAMELLRKTATAKGNAVETSQASVSSIEFDPSDENDSDPLIDLNGWRALKCALLILIVYAHCVLGILNYPMALFGALAMAWLSLVEPVSSSQGSIVNRVLVPTVLVLSSPLTIVAGLSLVFGANNTASILTTIAISFSNGTNSLALPYVFALYVPVQTLAWAVWTTPKSVAAKLKDE